MLMDHNKPTNPSQNQKQQSQQCFSQQIDDHLQQQDLKDSLQAHHRGRAKRKQTYDDFKGLVDIFCQLITHVNEHYRQIDKNPVVEEANLSLPQIINPNRLVNKKKLNRVQKSSGEDSKLSKQPERLKQHSLRKQPSFGSKDQEALRKSVSFNDGLAGKGMGNINDQAKKRTIWQNYSGIMNYAIHYSEDEGDSFPVNQVTRLHKQKNIEPSLSQYSFAHSSKIVEQKQRRRFSLQKMAGIQIIKSPKIMQILPQFQITQNKEVTKITNHFESKRESYNSQENESN